MENITIVKKSREEILSEIRGCYQAARRLEKKGGDNISDADLAAICRCFRIKAEYSPEMESMAAAYAKYRTWVDHVRFTNRWNARIGEAHVGDWTSIFGEKDAERMEYDPSEEPTAEEAEMAAEYAKLRGLKLPTPHLLAK